MDDPVPLRITFEHGSAAAVNRTFIGWFFVFAILFAGAAFYRPAIQVFTVAFPIFLVLWKLRLRKVTRAGGALVISPDRLRLESGKRSSEVERAEAEAVCIEQGGSRFGTRIILVVLNSAHVPAFQLEVDERDRKTILETLAAKGWPVQNNE